MKHKQLSNPFALSSIIHLFTRFSLVLPFLDRLYLDNQIFNYFSLDILPQVYIVIFL